MGKKVKRHKGTMKARPFPATLLIIFKLKENKLDFNLLGVYWGVGGAKGGGKIYFLVKQKLSSMSQVLL